MRNPAWPCAKGDPWNVTPDQVREVTRNLKTLLPAILEEDNGTLGSTVGAGGSSGWVGWKQGPDNRFWEVELPASIERCLSSSITNDQALPPIHELLLVSLTLIFVRISLVPEIQGQGSGKTFNVQVDILSYSSSPQALGRPKFVSPHGLCCGAATELNLSPTGNKL